jgi:hypothetical protein
VKQDGRTISRILSTEQAALYREWVDNRRVLEALLDEMRDLSREATEQLAAEAGVGFVGPPVHVATVDGSAERHVEPQNPGVSAHVPRRPISPG